MDKLFGILKTHLEPDQHYKFYQKVQSSEESVAKFVAELKRLAATCDFKDHLNEALRDHFVCGLKMAVARKKLLDQKELTLKKQWS